MILAMIGTAWLLGLGAVIYVFNQWSDVQASEGMLSAHKAVLKAEAEINMVLAGAHIKRANEAMDLVECIDEVLYEEGC